MNTIACLIAVAIVTMVMAEDCPTNNVNAECTHMTCADGFHKECINSICTCSTNSGCVLQTDCRDTADRTCNKKWHCVDNRCRCF
ncbi:serine protease inhibitor Cvsi-1-like [Dreissena polymorpha]|uniref:Uncharacterized protein n=1 Tax=Dreissena polymorpha TaxID=45954 RepID=A0A9D4LTY5_DREPO|nr:serine protease inhibitor Cvsi-1-like [Dreissena polymorpha]XP_052263773.1 serine protease inhibitor Cvsi-1-like [Dreissena polymorpha]KAH3782397.1 hypothetical protein DPMN_160312 [Dreissena polymorpha]KAH3864653.1 hypothetical protein DPMN_027676 [Dreissena polymorpha]